MATTAVLKDEPTRKVILAALWEHLAKADHKIDSFDDGLYALLSDGFRPDATDADYEAMRDRLDGLVTFLAEAREDVQRVETAELGTAVVLQAITKDELIEELDSYRRWIEDAREDFWKGGAELRQGLVARHDAIVALFAEFGEPAAVA
jgi:hypothetical protein